MKETAVFTISSKNYFAFSKTLLQSVSEHHHDVDLHFLLADEAGDGTTLDSKGVFVTCAKDIGIRDFEKMAFIYDIVEFNTAVKPFFIEYLFKKGYQKVIYLDPDILVCERLDAAIEKLDTHSIVVTPHQLSPVERVECSVLYLEWEQSALQDGIFNLGFIGVSNSSEGRSFIEWWCNRCQYLCFIEPQTGLLVDQKWINIALCYFPSLHVLRHKGYNMAIWNLHERKLHDGYINGEEPLVFYHFSSFDVNDREIISRHNRHMKLAERPDIVGLFEIYREKLQKNGWDHFNSMPYVYDYFHDGKKIELIERRLYSCVSEYFPDPFGTASKDFYAVLREKRRLGKCGSQNGNGGLGKTLLKAILKAIFFIVGPRRYTMLVQSFNRFDCLRCHSWLIE